MIVHISSDAEADVAQGYWFYEQQADRLGDYYRDCILADIDSLSFYAGIHEIAYGYHRMLAKTSFSRRCWQDAVIVTWDDADGTSKRSLPFVLLRRRSR